MSCLKKTKNIDTKKLPPIENLMEEVRKVLPEFFYNSGVSYKEEEGLFQFIEEKTGYSLLDIIAAKMKENNISISEGNVYKKSEDGKIELCDFDGNLLVGTCSQKDAKWALQTLKKENPDKRYCTGLPIDTGRGNIKSMCGIYEVLKKNLDLEKNRIDFEEFYYKKNQEKERTR